MVEPNKSRSTKDIKDTQSDSKCDWRSILRSSTCIQITAWLLLTIGLCIIASTFYVGLFNANRYIDSESGKGSYYGEDSDSYEYPIVAVTTMRSDTTTVIMLNKTVRSLRLSLADVKNEYSEKHRRCQENDCKVSCIHTHSLEDANILTNARTSCLTIDVLLIKNQFFPNGLLRNSWIKLNRSVYELELCDSNITAIACGAFNSPPFTNTYQLSLRDLKLEKLGGGVLLGLQSLRFLLISTPLTEINRAFFQPVQATLQHLSINSGLVLRPEKIIFGVSRLNKLEYLDLSNNEFVGPLTRRMFLATPNLHYLHICNSQITTIDSDAFDDLSNVLQVLDLSGNLLTSISGSTLHPLLTGSSRTLISLSYNRWHCDCQLFAFADFYHIYRKQFIDTIYCHTPYLYYGELLEELNFGNYDCITKIGLETTTENNAYTENGRTEVTEMKGLPSGPTAVTAITEPTAASVKVLTDKTANNTSNSASNEIFSSAEVEYRSSEDVSFMTLRCLWTPFTGTYTTQRDRRSFEITIQTPSSDVPQINETEFSTTSHEVNGSNEYQWNTYNLLPFETDNSKSGVEDSKPEFEDSELEITAMDDPTLYTQSHKKGERQRHISNMTDYELKMPTYIFTLTLLPNKSVKAIINDYNKYLPVNMIWFRSQSASSTSTTTSSSNKKTNKVGAKTENINYHCESYQPPYLIANDLTGNYTYTFCILTAQQTISPFDCQPIYITHGQHAADDTWISKDEKEFTIGIICMTFICSTLLGGIIGYVGILKYPELLEGSKNVVVVKGGGKEANYLNSVNSKGKSQYSSRSTGRLTSSHVETPPSSLPSPPPFFISNADLERLQSIKSTATCFEKAFTPPKLSIFDDDQYELPKQFSSLIYEDRRLNNPYATSPCSPPPLPKRNSSIASTIIANSLSKTE